MAKRYLLAVIFSTLFLTVSGQELDTLQLDEIWVRASSLEHYGTGGKQEDLSQELKGIYGNTDLTTLLQSTTPIYLRQLGAYGQTSSISFRGTGAGHTAVYWNGININSLTLGQTDFSQVPLFAGDELTLTFGSGAALTGTDAIGGAIHMNSGTKDRNGVELEFIQELGSFGLNRSFLTFGSGNSKWQNQTKVYYSFVRNDYNVSYRDTVYQQNNAISETYGLLQHSSYRINEKSSLKLDLWYQSNDRELQPKVGDFNNRDELSNQNLRVLIGYVGSQNNLNYQIDVGYVLDEQEYNGSESYGTDRWIMSGEVDHVLSEKFRYRAGFDIQRIQTNVDTYLENINETRADYFVSASYNPVERVEFSFNFRQTLIKDFDSRPAPSLGAEFEIFNTSKQRLSLKSLLSRSYKVPTFNDRYWDPGGNPELKPEYGWTAEAGLVHAVGNKNWELNSELTAFSMSVDDWIMWVPSGSIWTPNNVRTVNSSGMEFSHHILVSHGKSKWSGGMNVSWVEAINESGITENDGTAGKQLPYTPEWNASANIGWEYGPFSCTLYTRYTGERFTEQSNTSPALDAFQLWDMQVAMNKDFGSLKGKIYFSAFNITDLEYENFINRGMPGRNYQLGIKLNIEKPKHND